jgi:putative Ca2+/H+ antiporter (TMEM165/GDT1 family)
VEFAAALLVAFVAIFPVELPDKTFVATLVLATRYPPLPTWLGVSLAFAVQCVVAVLFGSLIGRLPDQPVRLAAAALFVIGGLVLFRGARKAGAAEAAEQREFEDKVRDVKTGWRAFGASFVVLFAAEWGDLSQLLTISLVGRYHDAVSVFIGAWGALLVVSGLAVVAGRFLLRYLRLSTIHYVGSAVCFLLAAVTAYQVVAG